MQRTGPHDCKTGWIACQCTLDSGSMKTNLVKESWNSEAMAILYVKEICVGPVRQALNHLCGRTESNGWDTSDGCCPDDNI